jgi:F-type H+-transporting ATPase subunit b
MQIWHIIKILSPYINFAILLWVLLKFGGAALKQFVKGRHDEVKEKVETAERLISESEQLKKTYEQKLAGLDSEIEAFRQAAVAEIEKEKNRILGEAQTMAGRIEEQARLAYAQEMKEALAKVRAEITRQTLDLAEQRVKEEFKKEDHEKLVDEFIEKLRSLN